MYRFKYLWSSLRSSLWFMPTLMVAASVILAVESLLSSAFDQIRRNAEGNVAVMSHMLGALDTIAGQTDRPRRRLALREQVQGIAELADRTIDSAHDRVPIEERIMRVLKALEAKPVVCADEEKGTARNDTDDKSQ